MKQASPWYRADIDGLRAIAVISVILFHFKITGFQGGFIGVDIFFVISGYLITSIILRELERGTFSLMNFWARRIKRILPVLSVVLITTTIVAYEILLYPSDIIGYGKSLFAQSIFLSNIFFLRQNNYFSETTEINPLLHTWSLSVEEQFYLFFPVLLMICFKFFKNKIKVLLIGLIAVSFVFNLYLCYWVPNGTISFLYLGEFFNDSLNTNVAFYFILSRIWELCAGSLLTVIRFQINSNLKAEILSAIGIILLTIGIFFTSTEYRFPGYIALLPVVGTVLVIFANTNFNTVVKRLLSFKPLVFIGLISYSLYLWHWPMYVFALSLTNQEQLNHLQTLAILLFSISLSFISYHFIELRFNKKLTNFSSLKIILVGVIVLALFASLGFSIVKYSSIIKPVPPTAERFLKDNLAEKTDPLDECVPIDTKEKQLGCLIGEKNANNITFVVWGDSHALSLLPIISSEARKRNLTGIVYVEPGCLPLPIVHDKKSSNSCLKMRSQAYRDVTKNYYSSVLIIGRWNLYENFTKDTAETKEIMTDLINKILSPQIYVMQQTPFQSHFNLRASYKQQLFLPTEYIDLSNSEIKYFDYINESAVERKTIGDLAQNPHVTIIDPAIILCPNQLNCLLTNDNKILYQDNNHLSTAGAEFIRPLFVKFFDTLKI